MGRLGKKEKDKGGKKRSILFGHRQKRRVDIGDEEEVQETYRAIGRVNARRLQGSLAWDVGYLGCVPDLNNWECPTTRTDFMHLVDSGQQRGQLMLYSLTPKRFHISSLWVTVTDTKKKVMYTEIPISSLGSLSYAEDDGKHILGIKAVQPMTVGGVSLGRHTPTPSEVGGGQSVLFCCHVFECGCEESVRQICSAVNERFKHLLEHQEALERQHRMEQEQQGHAVKPIMLKRLSTGAAADARHPAGKKERKKKLSKLKLSPKSNPFPSPAHESVSEFEYADVTGSEQGLPEDWSTSTLPLASTPPMPDIQPEREQVLDEIGHHFSAITKDPSRRRGGGRGRGPNVKRLSASGHKGSADRRRALLSSPGAESMESVEELVAPLKLNVVKKHSGIRLTQDLEDTAGIQLEDGLNVIVPRMKSRQSVLDIDNFIPSAFLEPMDVPSEPQPQPQPKASSNEQQQLQQEDSVLHTSLLLETMEEGEVETRIDGDESGTVLVQTHMSEKETAIVGEEGHAALLPASELDSEQAETEGQSSVPSPPPPPVEAPIEAPPQSPPPPPPEPVKQERQPWPAHLLVDVGKEPWDSTHKEFLDNVAIEVGQIVYRQFRKDWFLYQSCKMDVVGFCKKVKLAFRGNLVYLREGARVLVDEDDRQDFDDILAGKVVEPKGTTLASGTLPSTHIAIETSTAPTTKSVPSKLATPPAFSPAPSSTSRPPPPASSGSLGNRLKMFERSSSDSAPPPPAKKPGKIGRFMQNQRDEDESSDSAPQPKPARSGLLSRIAMFEGGPLPTIEEEDRPSPKSQRRRENDDVNRRGRGDYGKVREDEGRDRIRGKERAKGRDKGRDDSDDDRKERRRHRSPESKRERHRKGEDSGEEKGKGRGGRHKDRRGGRRSDDSEEERKSKRRKDRGRRDKDFSDDDSKKRKDRRKRSESDEDKGKHKDKRDDSEDDRRRQKGHRKRDESDDDRKSRKKGRDKRRDDSSDDGRKSKKTKDKREKEREGKKGKQFQTSPKQEADDSTGLQGILSVGSKLLGFSKEEEIVEVKEKDAIGELAQLLSGQEKSVISSSKETKPSSSSVSRDQKKLASARPQEYQPTSHLQQAASHLQYQLDRQQPAASLLQEQQQLASLQQQQQMALLQQQQQQLAVAYQQAQTYQPQQGGYQQPGMMMGQANYNQLQQTQQYYQPSYQVQPAQQAQSVQPYQQYQSYLEQQPYMAQQNTTYQTPLQNHAQPGNIVGSNVTPPIMSTSTAPPQQFQNLPPPPPPVSQGYQQPPAITSVPGTASLPQQTQPPPPVSTSSTEQLPPTSTAQDPPEQPTQVTHAALQPDGTSTPPHETPPPPPPQPNFDETAADEEEVELTRFSEESDDEEKPVQEVAEGEGPPQPPSNTTPPNGPSQLPPSDTPPDGDGPSQPPPNDTPPASQVGTMAADPPSSTPPPPPPPVDYDKRPKPPPIDYDKQPPLPPVDYDRPPGSAPPPPPPPPLETSGSAPPPPPPPPPAVDNNNQANSAAPPPPPPPPTQSIKSMSEIHEERDNFLDEIRQGKQLKPTERKSSTSSVQGDFLEEIKQGKQLKPTKMLTKEDRKASTTSIQDELMSEIRSGKQLRKVSKDEIRDRSGRSSRRKGFDVAIDSMLRMGNPQERNLSLQEELMANILTPQKLRQVSEDEQNTYAKAEESKKGKFQLDEADSKHVDRIRHAREESREEPDKEKRGQRHHHRRRGEDEEDREEKDHRSRRHRHGQEGRRHRRKHSDEEENEERHSRRHHHKRRDSDDEELGSRDRHHKKREDSGDEEKKSRGQYHKREHSRERDSKERRHKKNDDSDEERRGRGQHRQRRDEDDRRERHRERDDHSHRHDYHSHRDDHHGDDRGRRQRDDSRERRSSDRDRRHRKDSGHDSGKDSPPSSSRAAERKSTHTASSQTRGGAQSVKKEDKVPAWKVALMKRREEKQVSKNPEKVIDILEQDPLDLNDDIPAWKRAMLKKKQSQVKAQEQDKAKREAEAEAKFEGVPAWKKEIMMKKEAQKQAARAAEMEKQKEEQDKIEMVRSMPEWRRKLFLQKNPDFVFPG